jgi:hypothetical protein
MCEMMHDALWKPIINDKTTYKEQKRKEKRKERNMYVNSTIMQGIVSKCINRFISMHTFHPF